MFLPLHDSAPLRVIRFQFVTGVIIMLNVAVFLISHYVVSPAEVKQIPLSFGAIPAVITDRAELAAALHVIPEKATLFTYMFLHGGWMHLIGNMLFMWVFADNVEDGFGHLGFIVFYFVCGLAAVAAHIALSPGSQAPIIGASGAVAGVLGAYILLFPRSRVIFLLFMRFPLRLAAVWVLAAWLGFQLFMIYSGGGAAGHVALWAHVGGFAAGFLITLVLRGRILRRLGRTRIVSLEDERGQEA